MSILGEPKFSDVPPLRRHFIYGVNCLGFVRGDTPTVLTVSGRANKFAYYTPMPGMMTEKVWGLMGNSPRCPIDKSLLAKMAFDGCHEEGYVPIDSQTFSPAINLPSGTTLIALYTSTWHGNFHFLKHNPVSMKWDHKYVMSDVRSIETLAPTILDHYEFNGFFVIPKHHSPVMDVPSLSIITLSDGETTLRHCHEAPPAFRGVMMHVQNQSLIYEDRARNVKCQALALPPQIDVFLPNTPVFSVG